MAVDKTLYAPVTVRKDTYARAKEYSNLTGVPITKIVEEALSDWLDTVGRARAEIMQSRAGGDILRQPAPVIPISGPMFEA